jgi:nucleoside-diphosphate-sugar epimerase
MTYLVTGGAGFIGSNIVRRLLDAGGAVRVLDNLATGRAANLEDVRGRIEWIEGDMRDLAVARRAVAGATFVLHLAALPSVARSVADPLLANGANIDGLLNMLVAARDAGVKRFVFSSSSSVYGDTPVLPKVETMPPRPLSPYAAQKLAGEHYCRVFHGLYGLPTVSLRYFNVFGPRQDPTSQYSAAIPLFIAAIRAGRPPTIYGDGEQTRDFTFVEDVVDANLRACEAPDAACGDVFNVSGGRRTSVNQLVRTIDRLLGADVKPVHVPARKGDVRDSLGDTTRAAQMLNWRPRFTFEQGLERTVRFYAGR